MAIVEDKVQFVKPKPAKDFFSQSLADQWRAILSQIQGEAVILKEDLPLEFVLKTFVLALEVCPAVFLENKKGKFFCLFNFLGPETQIPFPADNSFCVSVQVKESIPIVKEQEIDLSQIDFKQPEAIVKALKKQVKLAEVSTIKGEAPLIVYLLALRILKNKTAEIWLKYKEREVRVY